MPRKNSPSHGRRRQAGPPPLKAEPPARSGEGMARALIDRGLASPLILDDPRYAPTKENR
jgi:hypothetical protein